MITNLRYVRYPDGTTQLQALHTPVTGNREPVWLDVPVFDDPPQPAKIYGAACVTIPTVPTVELPLLVAAIEAQTLPGTPWRQLCERVYQTATGRKFPVQ